METAFTVTLLLLVLLFYFSNRNNNVNKWCAISGFIFWLGVAKEAVLFSTIPFLQAHYGFEGLDRAFMPIYSCCTWALYSLAMPTALIYALYFYGMDKRMQGRFRTLQALLYVPGILLSFYFTPFQFRTFQLSSLPFWITYSLYNMGFVIAYCVFFVRGVRMETGPRERRQKSLVRGISLPPVLYWYITVFPVHTLGLQGLFKLWQGNAIILAVCLVAFVYLAFRYGIMGLKLSGETYQWDSRMNLINKSAVYTGHMVKGQTAKMEWCIDNLNRMFDGHSEDAPEELAILSRSITTLKSYTEKMRQYSQSIELEPGMNSLYEMVEQALPVTLRETGGKIRLQRNVPREITWHCDYAHMVEVLENIITNAVEATPNGGEVIITGKNDELTVEDSGVGIDEAEIKNVFAPYYTTKNMERNFGLGLAYCKNVVEAHRGEIEIGRRPENGTIVTIRLSADMKAKKIGGALWKRR